MADGTKSWGWRLAEAGVATALFACVGLFAWSRLGPSDPILLADRPRGLLDGSDFVMEYLERSDCPYEFEEGFLRLADDATTRRHLVRLLALLGQTLELAHQDQRRFLETQEGYFAALRPSPGRSAEPDPVRELPWTVCSGAKTGLKIDTRWVTVDCRGEGPFVERIRSLEGLYETVATALQKSDDRVVFPGRFVAIAQEEPNEPLPERPPAPIVAQRPEPEAAWSPSRPIERAIRPEAADPDNAPPAMRGTARPLRLVDDDTP